jgi:hypothetical protein
VGRMPGRVTSGVNRDEQLLAGDEMRQAADELHIAVTSRSLTRARSHGGRFNASDEISEKTKQLLITSNDKIAGDRSEPFRRHTLK